MDLADATPEPAPGLPSEEEAWAAVRAAWGDDAAHRAYLARFSDLEGLAVAGRRYRDALVAAPADPVAARWRDEVMKRATVAGLAQLPRSAPAPAAPPWVRRAVWVAAGVLLVLLAAWTVRTALALLGGRP
jgi:hypothetical protein